MVCAPGEICQREGVSHHHAGNGHGPVSNDEVVVYVFFGDALRIGDKLTPDQFPGKRLGRGEISLARKSYATLEDIQQFVIKGAAVVGASSAITGEIRLIAPEIGGATSRGVCVLDDVVAGDHDSHAALRECAHQNAMKDKAKNTARILVAADLADKFGPIEDIAAVFRAAGGPI